MRWVASTTLIAQLALTACNAPTTHFAEIDPVRVSAMGSTFDLRRRTDRIDTVQVIRVNSEYAPRLSQQLGRRAEIAVESTYGCPVSQIRGDAAVMVAYLKCDQLDDLARIANGS